MDFIPLEAQPPKHNPAATIMEQSAIASPLVDISHTSSCGILDVTGIAQQKVPAPITESSQNDHAGRYFCLRPRYWDFT